jgi:hypothetical protein
MEKVPRMGREADSRGTVFRQRHSPSGAVRIPSERHDFSPGQNGHTSSRVGIFLQENSALVLQTFATLYGIFASNMLWANAEVGLPRQAQKRTWLLHLSGLHQRRQLSIHTRRQVGPITMAVLG